MVILKNSTLLKTQSYINGKWSNADNNQTFAVLNPYDGNVLAEITDAGVAETRRAIEAAHQAGQIWRQTSIKERNKLLIQWAECIRADFSDHVKLLTLEQGKPLEQAKLDVEYIITTLHWYAAEAIRVHGHTIASLDGNTRVMTIKQPIGVVAAIAPWNFPSGICMQQCVPAIAAGCTVVFKPAQDTPLTALALASAAEKAGIPAGVFNVITCEKPEAVGNELANHHLVRKLSFTGSTATGKLLAAKAAATVKNVCLELGGNCPFIIFADANLDAAVEQAIGLKFFNAGQVCNGVNRFLIEETVYDTVIDKFIEQAKQLKLGSGLEPDTTLGPLINAAALQKVQRLINDAQQQGAQLKLGGKSHANSKLLYEPTVLSNVTPKAAMYHEEIFGPVAAFYRFKNETQAIEMANDTRYGLAAYFFTTNLDRTHRVSEALEAGSVGINTTSIFGETLPFGGVKESGIGREGGVIGSLDSYYEIKTIAAGNG